MGLKIYQLRIGKGTPSLLKRFQNSVDELPPGSRFVVKTGIAAVGAVSLAAPLQTGILAVAKARKLGILAAGAIAVLKSDDDHLIEIIRSPDELERFSNSSGKAWENSTYIAHPKNPGILLLATEFHRLIALEQIVELIEYLKSKVALSRYKIEVTAAREGKAGFKAPTELGASAGGEVSFTQSQALKVEKQERNPLPIPMTKEPLWLSHFPIITSSLEGARSGTATFHEKQDFSFGIKAGFADRIGVDATWLNPQMFSVTIEYGPEGDWS